MQLQVGDSPLIIRGAGFEVVMADTSFSDVTATDMRGVAVANITVLFANPAVQSPSTVSVCGVLQDEQQYVHAIPAARPHDTKTRSSTHLLAFALDSTNILCRPVLIRPFFALSLSPLLLPACQVCF